MVTTREFWYSPELGINLGSTLETPGLGLQKFFVTEITTLEPDASFFSPPDGYSVVDHREPAPSAH
jgi:hypothetical protein